MSSSTKHSSNSIKLQANVLFRLNQSVLPDGGEASSYSEALKLYHLQHCIVRVETCSNLPYPEVRYGIMLASPSDLKKRNKRGFYPNRSYIFDIPVKAHSPKERQLEQEALIKDYLSAMRKNFKDVYQAITHIENDPNIDITTRVDKQIKQATETEKKNNAQISSDSKRDDSSNIATRIKTQDPVLYPVNTSDGKWGVLKAFRYSRDYPDVAEWFVKKFLPRGASYSSESLQCYAMTFQEGQEYAIAVDWLDAYITFDDEKKANLIKQASNDAETSLKEAFYPFYNFSQQQDPEMCTRLTLNATHINLLSEDPNYSLPLMPGYYTLYGFYSRAIDAFLQKQESLSRLTQTYQGYIQHLNILHSILKQQGPLRDISDDQLKIIREAEPRENWNGIPVDYQKDPEQHIKDFNQGLLDIEEAIALFSQVIAAEGSKGDPSIVRDELMQLAKVLFDSFWIRDDPRVNKTNYTKLCYDKLWRFNTDTFGFDLVTEQMLHLLRDTDQAENIYTSYLAPNLYGNKRLDRTDSGVSYSASDEDWLNILYRATNVSTATWVRYYEFHEVKLMGASLSKAELAQTLHDYQQRVEEQRKNHKSSKKHIRRFVKGGAKYKPNKLKQPLIMPDRQLEKFANYLLGGSQEKKLNTLKNEMLTELRKLLKNVDLKQLSHKEQDALLQRAIETKKDLMTKNFPEYSSTASDISNRVITVVNMVLARFAFTNFNHNVSRDGGDVEGYLRMYSFSIGLVSDIANTYYFSKHGISPTLSHQAAREMTGTIGKTSAAHMARSLGLFQAIGGGAGGLLGVYWSLSDASNNFFSGAYNNTILDSISAVGCMLSVWSLAFYASAFGAWLGFALNVTGFILVFGSQLAKAAHTFDPEMKSYCASIAKQCNEFSSWTEASALLTMGYQIPSKEQYKTGVFDDTQGQQKQDQSTLNRILLFLGADNTYDQVKNIFGDTPKHDMTDYMLEGTKTLNPVF